MNWISSLRRFNDVRSSIFWLNISAASSKNTIPGGYTFDWRTKSCTNPVLESLPTSYWFLEAVRTNQRITGVASEDYLVSIKMSLSLCKTDVRWRKYENTSQTSQTVVSVCPNPLQIIVRLKSTSIRILCLNLGRVARNAHYRSMIYLLSGMFCLNAF